MAGRNLARFKASEDSTVYATHPPIHPSIRRHTHPLRNHDPIFTRGGHERAGGLTCGRFLHLGRGESGARTIGGASFHPFASTFVDVAPRGHRYPSCSGRRCPKQAGAEKRRTLPLRHVQADPKERPCLLFTCLFYFFRYEVGKKKHITSVHGVAKLLAFQTRHFQPDMCTRYSVQVIGPLVIHYFLEEFCVRN